MSETIQTKDSRLRHNESYTETADIETSSEDYAKRFSGEVGSWFLKVQEDISLKILASSPGAKILDVGGGHGQLTEGLIENGYNVTVFGSADICKSRIQKFVDENRCAYHTGNILDLPYKNQFFDIVISYRLLPHVKKWRQLISELTRVARKAVVVDFPSIYSLNCISPILFSVKKRLEGNTRPFILFRQSDLLTTFMQNGFVFSNRFPQFFLPMVLHRVIGFPLLSRAVERVCHLTGLTGNLGSPVILELVRKNER